MTFASLKLPVSRQKSTSQNPRPGQSQLKGVAEVLGAGICKRLDGEGRTTSMWPSPRRGEDCLCRGTRLENADQQVPELPGAKPVPPALIRLQLRPTKLPELVRRSKYAEEAGGLPVLSQKAGTASTTCATQIHAQGSLPCKQKLRSLKAVSVRGLESKIQDIRRGSGLQTPDLPSTS